MSVAPYRKIIHIDMDAFFASVEQRDDPTLRGRPVVVGGSPERRGVVAAASYEARRYGIHSAMPSRTAAQKCPELIFMPPRFSVYREISRQIRTIFQQYTKLVEPVALDEAYLDVTENHYHQSSAMVIAREIKKLIYEQTHLTASAGVSNNKFLAKMACGLNKPNGLSLIRPEEAAAFVQGLSIKKFHGIGKVTAAKMYSLGIITGADLLKWSDASLVEKFGKVGHYFYDIARGQDFRPVNPNRIRKSIGAERSYSEELRDQGQILSELETIAQLLDHRIQENHICGHTLILKIKYGNYQQITRSQTIRDVIAGASMINEIATSLLLTYLDINQTVRLLGLSVTNLEQQDKLPLQLCLDLK